MRSVVVMFVMSCVIQLLDCLDFESAVASHKFRPWAGSDNPVLLDPDTENASVAYYYQRNSSVGKEARMRFLVDDHWTSYKIGLSILFVKINLREGIDSINVEVLKNSAIQESKNLTKSYDLPLSEYDPNVISKTWKSADFGSEKTQWEIKVTLNNWNLVSDSNFYFVVTSYRIYENNHGRAICPSEEGLKWFDCARGEDWSRAICLNYQLTCDDLPHCADTRLPNPDENCGYQVNIEDALSLLLYCMVAVFLLMFIALMGKCARARYRTSRHCATQEILDYETSTEVTRPTNAPPTYDDAMKFASEGDSESEHDDSNGVEDDIDSRRRPPQYSEFPRSGEVIIDRVLNEASLHSSYQDGMDNALSVPGADSTIQHVSRWSGPPSAAAAAFTSLGAAGPPSAASEFTSLGAAGQSPATATLLGAAAVQSNQPQQKAQARCSCSDNIKSKKQKLDQEDRQLLKDLEAVRVSADANHAGQTEAAPASPDPSPFRITPELSSMDSSPWRVGTETGSSHPSLSRHRPETVGSASLPSSRIGPNTDGARGDNGGMTISSSTTDNGLAIFVISPRSCSSRLGAIPKDPPAYSELYTANNREG